MRRSLAPLSLLLAAGVTLAACGSDTISENIAEKAIEAGSDGNVDVDLDADGGGVNIETEDGTFSADEDGNVVIESEDGTFSSGTTDELPDDFPDVPLPEMAITTVTEASDDTGTTYIISGESSDDPAAILDDYVSTMEAEGYTTGGRSTTSDGPSFFGGATFTDGGDFDVSLSVIGDGSDKAIISVTVLPASA